VPFESGPFARTLTHLVNYDRRLLYENDFPELETTLDAIRVASGLFTSKHSRPAVLVIDNVN
jgi:hypothetical protein